MPRTKHAASTEPAPKRRRTKPPPPAKKRRTKQPLKKASTRTKRPKFTPSCRTCIGWRKGMSISYDFKNPLSAQRRCASTGQTITPLDLSCSQYDISKIFYCHDRACFMYAEACAHRHKRIKCEDCKPCRDGKAVSIHLASNPDWDKE